MELIKREENYEGWLNQRAKTVGSSQICTILGLSGYESCLSLWKRYREKDMLIEDNDFLYFGKMAEPIVIGLFERQTGFKVEANGETVSLARKGFEFAVATPDGFYLKDSDPVLLECKTSTRDYDLWKVEELPIYVACQVQWQMGVVGVKKATVACLLGGYPDLIKIDVDFDPEVFEMMLKAAQGFLKMVHEGKQPPAGALDAKILRELNPQEKGLQVEISGSEMASLAERWLQLGSERKIAEFAAKKLKEEQDAIQNKIVQKMGKAQLGYFAESNLVAKATEVKMPAQVRNPYVYTRFSIKEA